METILQRPDYPKVQREVRRIHDDFAISSPPVNPVAIARDLGIKVLFARFNQGFENVAGFYDCQDNAIFVNAEEFPLRQTFTVAHELGHAVLHREWAESADYQMLLRDGSYDGDDFHEREANAFAAHLLVPRFLLDEYFEDNSISELSKLFAVSVPVIKNRLNFEYGIV